MINLKEVLTKYPECLESASKLRSYLVDIYPEEKARIRVIVDSFDCGIYEKIKNADNADKLFLNRLYSTLEKDYGYSHTISEWCVSEWLKFLNKESFLKVSVLVNQKNLNIETQFDVLENKTHESVVDDKKEENNIVYKNKTQAEASDFQTKIITLNNKKSIVITKYIGFESSKIVVPNMIDGIPVVSIGENAFENIKSREIYISDGITKINRHAFRFCSSLTTVRLPNTLSEICEGAFLSCKNLETIKFPKSLQIIGDHAFANCERLFNITLPRQLQRIGSWSFSNCSSLDYLEIPSTINTIPLGLCYECFALDFLIIKDGVKKIGGDILAFSSDKRFHVTVRIPSSVTSLGYTAFSGLSYNTNSKIVCDRGSAALVYAREHNIIFEEYQGSIKLNIEQAQDFAALRDKDIKKFRRQLGICQHCGGQFKGLIFKRCSICGKPKDY